MSKKKKNKFAEAVIIICLAISIIITAVTLYEYHRLGEVLPSGVISAMYGLFGGELLIVCLRQVLGSDITQKKTKNESEDTSI